MFSGKDGRGDKRWKCEHRCLVYNIYLIIRWSWFTWFSWFRGSTNSPCLFGSILLGHLLFWSSWSSASGQMGFRVAWVPLSYTLYTSLNTNATSPVYIWIVFALHLIITWCNAILRISSFNDNLVLFQVFDAGRMKVSDSLQNLWKLPEIWPLQNI